MLHGKSLTVSGFSVLQFLLFYCSAITFIRIDVVPVSPDVLSILKLSCGWIYLSRHMQCSEYPRDRYFLSFIVLHDLQGIKIYRHKVLFKSVYNWSIFAVIKIRNRWSWPFCKPMCISIGILQLEGVSGAVSRLIFRS